jgi:hypothetical protein
MNWAHPLTGKLVAAWLPGVVSGIPGRGDVVGAIIRDLVYANNAVANPGIDFVANPVFGMALNLNNSGRAQAPALLPAYTQAGFLTCATWIQMPATISGHRCMFGDDFYEFGYVRCWQTRTYNSKFEFLAWNSGGSIVAATSVQTPVANTIYLIVGTYDGANVNLYVNGLLDKATALVGTAAAVPNYVPWVGARPGESWTGLLGPTMWWKRVLSAAEVWQLWHPATRWAWLQPVSRTWRIPYVTGAPVVSRARSFGWAI